jgi:protein-S-isoprenylcysteine O-methyltransferase Ste14
MSGSATPQRDRVIAWSLVTGQLLLLVALIPVPRGDDWPVTGPLWIAAGALGVVALVGLGASALNLGSSLTASPLPLENAALRTTGAYRYVRHPIYSFVLLFSVALVMVSGSFLRLLPFVALVVLLSAKARWEERHLAARHGEYAAYCARTPRFVPWTRGLR